MSFWQWIKDWFSPAPAPPPGPPPGPVVDASPARIISLINDERRKYGMFPMVEDPRLVLSAHDHCTTMVVMNQFSHQCTGEPSFDMRIAGRGYTPFSYVSENLAAGQTSPEQVVADWMDEVPPNDGHRRAIFGPARHAGSALAQGGSYGWYWTTDFGAP